MSTSEVVSSVNQAMEAKTSLVSDALRRKQIEAQREQMRLHQLHQKVQTLSQQHEIEIARKRQKVELAVAKVDFLGKDVDKKRTIMEAATKDFVQAQEKYDELVEDFRAKQEAFRTKAVELREQFVKEQKRKG